MRWKASALSEFDARSTRENSRLEYKPFRSQKKMKELMESHFLLVLYFFAAAIGFGIGFELPLVLRINALLGRELPTMRWTFGDLV